MKCICGHYEEEHTYTFSLYLELNKACTYKINKQEWFDRYCPCLRFKLDNLSYLEYKYEEQKNLQAP